MRLIGLLITCLLFIQVGIAQEPEPPPPALIYSPPTTNSISKYLPADRSFEVEFPGKPTERVQKLEYGTLTTYVVSRKGSNSGVGITERFDTTDVAANRDDVFETMRRAVLARPETSIVKETEIVLGNFKGREFEIERGLKYQIVRVYLVGSRVIEVQSDVTNWHILSDKTKMEWRNETRRFFDSFKILK